MPFALRVNRYDHGALVGACVSAATPEFPFASSRPFGRRALLILIAVLVLGVRCQARSGDKHLVTLADLLSLKGGNMHARLSPDGRWLAYAARKRIWILRVRPRGVARAIASGRLPRWSPDGRRLAFYSDHSGRLQLWVFDLRMNRAEQMTHLKGGIDPDPWTRLMGFFDDAFRFSWSPDGSRLVFASRVSSTERSPKTRRNTQAEARSNGVPLILTGTTPRDWTLSGIFMHGFGTAGWRNGEPRYDSDGDSLATAVNQLFLVDVRTKSLRQLTTGRAGYFDPDWSPDGRWIACVSSDAESLEDHNSVPTNIYRLDVRTGKRVAVTTGPGEKSMPLWSPDSRRIAYFESSDFGIRHAFVVSAAGGPATPIPPLDRFIQNLQWAPDSRSVVLAYRDGVTVPVARVEIATGVIKILSGSDAAYRYSLTGSATGAVAWEETGAYTVGVIRLWRPGEPSASVLVDMNPQIKQWKLGRQKVVRWRNHQGEEMEGLVLLPVDYRKGHRYPLILDLYPMQLDDLKGALSGNQAWASRGYAIFWPNAPAPHVWPNAFTSEAYSLSAKGPEGWKVTYDDVMSGVDALIQRGIVDPDRMGLYGFSNGGGVVNYLVTQTNRFRCAVSVAGAVSDWLRPALLGGESAFMEELEGGADPWSNPEPFIELSAVFRLKEVATPVLLADGDEDGDFLLNTIEMYNGLRWFGKKVTLLRYPGQAHGFTGAALRDFWNRENSFFGKYLQPALPSRN